MRGTDPPTGFAWLAPHDAARRDAGVLFGVALAVLGFYSFGVFALVVLVAEASAAGTADRLASFDIGTVVAVGAIGIACVTAAALFTLAAWRGARNRRARDVGTRRPTAAEAAHVRRALAEATEPYGTEPPRFAIHDDAAPNGASWVSPAGATVCLTTGALELPAAELNALCRQLVTGLASPARNRAVDAVDLVLIAERWAQFVWTIGIGAFVLAVVATNRTVAAGVLVGVVVLVLVTRPAILLATRALPGLFNRIDELIDLETTRRSADPEPLAHLLVHLLEDDRQVRTSWRVVHLWFERDAVEAVPARGGDRVGNGPLYLGTPGAGTPIQRVWARTARATLAGRARVAVNLASGDRKLRTRLDRAAAG